MDLELLLGKKKTFNQQFNTVVEIRDSIYNENNSKEDIRKIMDSLEEETSDLIYRCINAMSKINSRSQYMRNITAESEEDDVLFGHLLMTMSRHISCKRIPAPMAISSNLTELSLEVNPLFLLDCLDPIEDKYNEQEIATSLETDNCPAGAWYMLQIISILCHEALHVVYDHLASYNNEVIITEQLHRLMNIATDCTINQYLKFLPQTKGLVTLDSVKQMTNNPDLKEKDASVVYYNELVKAMEEQQQEEQDKQEGQGDGEGGTSSGSSQDSGMPQEALDDLEEKLAGMTPEELEEFKEALKASARNGSVDSHDGFGKNNETNDAQLGELTSEIVKQALQEAYDSYQEDKMMNGKNRGTLSSDIQERIDLLNEKTKMDWKQVLKKKIGTLAVPYRLSKNRINRRQSGRPELRGRINDRTVKITFAIDTSGSMSSDTLTYCLQELYTLLSVYKFKLTVIEFDADINKVYEVDDPRKIDPKMSGRGGTSFQPVFDYTKQHRYKNREDLLIIMTDGGGENHVDYGYFSHIMWLLVDSAFYNRGTPYLSVENPKGQVLYLDDDKKYQEFLENK